MRSRPVLFDTNVFIGVFLSGSRDAARCRRYLLDTYDEVRCAVVLHELLRGDKLVDRRRWREQRKATGYDLPGSLVDAPSLEDWTTAGRALQELRIDDIVRLRKMTNDALIASLCVRRDLDLISADSDFLELKNTRYLRDLRVVPWERLRDRILSS